MPVKTRRPLGQHFLLNPRFLRYVAQRLELQPGETVLEIGAGPGNLTRSLAETGASVIAVEKDEGFKEAHAALRAEFPHLTFVYHDAVRWSWDQLPSSYKVAGNLPFAVASQVLIRLVQKDPAPKRAVLLLQKELARRVAAPPGNRTYGSLSVLVQTRYRIALLKVLPPGAFTPPPRVSAGLIELTPKDEPPLDDDYLRFVRRLFQQRRKKLGNTMSEIGADESLRATYGDLRAESLHWRQVQALYEQLKERGEPQQARRKPFS